MLGFFIGLMTAVIVIDCILLVLLVLIQLPKKDAGAGVAFGGAATDALFGAGSGTALTKITKYCAGLFLAGTLLLSVMHSYANNRKSSGVIDELGRVGSRPGEAAIVAPPTTNRPAPGLLTPNTNRPAPGLLTPNTNRLITPNTTAPSTATPATTTPAPATTQPAPSSQTTPQ